MRLLFTLLLLVSTICSYAQIEKIKAARFTSIRSFGPFKVTLIKAEAAGAEIDYQGLDPEDVLIKCDDRELHIKLRNQSFLDFNGDQYKSRNKPYAIVTIYYTSLDNIEAKAGTIIVAEETIVAKNLTLISKMGAEMRLDIKTERLELDSSMGSEVELTGTATTADIKSKMGSNVNASMLQSQKVTVTSSMGSEVSVFAENELNASADFGASISYKGNPRHKSTSRFLGAEVNPKK